jgi:hypothetical protein
MKSNHSLFSVTPVQITLLGLLLCALSLGLAPQGFAADNPDSSAWAIQVQPVQAEEGQLPPDFSMAVYEDVVAQLVKGKSFQHVYRSGDRQAEGIPNLLVLHMTLLNFEHGNQTERAVTTVKGATKIQVHLKVSPHGGNAVVERDVQGTVRFFGENLKATNALAKRIAAVLQQTSLPPPGTAKAAGQ